MKVIVCIIASDNMNYTQFKQNWITNIQYVKSDPMLKDSFDFFFLYSDDTQQNKVVLSENNSTLYTDFYDGVAQSSFGDVTHSILFRTIVFFQSIIKSNPNTDGMYFLRTNISTAFDFKVMFQWLQNKPRNNFFAGSFNGLYYGIDTKMSGTNMVMTFDIIKYLVDNRFDLDLNMYEDEAISCMIIQNLDVILLNIKRLDFIEIEASKRPDYYYPAIPCSIVYHKTHIGDEDIFTFRFKTFNRENDIEVMKYIIHEIWKPQYNSNNVVRSVSSMYHPSLPLQHEAPFYNELYSTTPFKIPKLPINNIPPPIVANRI